MSSVPATRDQPPAGVTGTGENAEREQPGHPGEVGGDTGAPGTGTETGGTGDTGGDTGGAGKVGQDSGARDPGETSDRTRSSGAPSKRNPLVLPNPVEPPASLQALQQELEAVFAKVPGTFGMAVVDLTTGEEMGIQPGRVFPAASTYKLPLAMYVLNEVAEGRASLEDMVEFKKEDWQGGAGVLQNTIKEGDKVSVKQLVELAITQSDNIAAMMLRRHFGPSNFAAYRQQMGETQLYWTDASGELYFGATPRAMTRYLIALYRGEGIAAPALNKYLLDLLCRTAWRDRIDGGVPDSVPVAHKVGTLDGIINDVGLVLHPTRPYVMTFYSQGLEHYEDGVAVAEYASRRVYEYFSAVAEGKLANSEPGQ